MYNFFYNVNEFLQFFPKLCDTQGRLGGTRGPGGPPRKGYPTWVPPGNNLDILRFWNILELFIKHNKQKKRDIPNLGGARSQLGGCFGGVVSTGGPPRFGRSRFFCLLCLNNYSKILQKRRISKLLLGGYPCGVPFRGGPPRAPGAPQASLGVTEFWKKLQKFLKII